MPYFSRYQNLLVFILFALFGLVLIRPIYSQSYIPTNLPQPGITCGNPRASGDLKKCCQTPFVTPGPVKFNNNTLDLAYSIIAPFVDKMTNPIIKKTKEINIKPCIEGVPSTPGDVNNAKCICVQEKPGDLTEVFATACSAIKDKDEANSCNKCSKDGGVHTALGCFTGSLSTFISENILKTGVSLAGGISLLCIIFAAFQMQTSRGNAEKIKKAQELLTNCITGLMVVIFSVLILKIIGVDILRIPGFGN